MTKITVRAMKSNAIPMGDWGIKLGSQQSDKGKLVRFNGNGRSSNSYG